MSSPSLWVPPDISQICTEQTAPLTQCSQTGFLYLTLITQLFGGLIKDQDFSEEKLNTFGFKSLESPSFETSIPEPPQDPLVSTPLKVNPEVETTTPFSPVLQEPVVNYTLTAQEPNNYVSQTISPPESEKLESGEVTKAKDENNKIRQNEHLQEYDFIIVGAGSAGCVLANRLSEVKKWKILLLEAGPEEPEVTIVPALAPALAGSNIDWGYKTQPEKLSCRALRGQACPMIKGKTIGGSSSVNDMVYMRGNKADYDGWAEQGNLGWSYDEVLPYFKKAENNQDIESLSKYYHSVGGPLNVERFPYFDNNVQTVIQAYREMGLPITDFNGESQFGTAIAQSTSIDGKRLSTNTAYIRPIRYKRPNLTILNQAYTSKLIINQETKTAIGVEYIKEGVIYAAYASKEVIVSSGPINSPKLLMLSGIGPKVHLERLNITVLSDLKVGYNLQDHVTTEALILSLPNTTSTLVDREQLFSKIHDYHSQPPQKYGPLSSTNMLSEVAFIKTEFAVNDLPDIQIQVDVKNVEEFYSDPQTYLATNVFPIPFYTGLSYKPLLLIPKSRGHIKLNHTDPVFGPPLIYPGFFAEQIDIDRLVASMRFVVSLEDTPTFKQIGATFVRVPIRGCEDHIWGTNEYFTCLLTHYTSSIYHTTGTCKMGPSCDRDAVVDARLRVYGIKQLRVIDSSIMPSIVRGNINAPTIMIAEKAADIVKEDWYHCI